MKNRTFLKLETLRYLSGLVSFVRFFWSQSSSFFLLILLIPGLPKQSAFIGTTTSENLGASESVVWGPAVSTTLTHNGATFSIYCFIWDGPIVITLAHVARSESSEQSSPSSLLPSFVYISLSHDVGISTGSFTALGNGQRSFTWCSTPSTHTVWRLTNAVTILIFHFYAHLFDWAAQCLSSHIFWSHVWTTLEGFRQPGHHIVEGVIFLINWFACFMSGCLAVWVYLLYLVQLHATVGCSTYLRHWLHLIFFYLQSPLQYSGDPVCFILIWSPSLTNTPWLPPRKYSGVSAWASCLQS